MIDATFLSVAVTTLEMADAAQRELDIKKGAVSAVRNTSKARGSSAEKKARQRRATLHEALLTATCGDAGWKQKVDDATGTAEDTGEVADSIERQVAVGRDLAAWAKKRGVSCALNEAYFTKALQLAASCRKLGAEGAAPASRDGINQGEVDRLDGRCLWLLKRAVDCFDVAHGVDPTIPRLAVLSLRSVFGRGTSQKRKTAPVKPPTG